MPRTQFATRYDFRAPGADPGTRQELFACGGLPAEPSWAGLRPVCETVLPAVRG